MDIKEIQAWRTIVAIIRETGYDKLYDEEVNIVAEYLRRCEQQCKKQKEVIDKIYEFIKELYDNTDDTTCYEIDRNRKEELLDILNEGKNE